MSAPLDVRLGHALPPELSAALDAELRGERLVWWGMPNPARHVLGTLPMVLFAIPWTAFSVFWMVAASGLAFFATEDGSSWERSLFSLFGVPFVGVGLWMLTSPLWAYRRGQRTVYALTDKRALVLLPRKVKSFAPADLRAVERNQRLDGSGDLYFAESFVRGKHGLRRVPEGFEGIHDPRGVEDLLRDTLQPAGPA